MINLLPPKVKQQIKREYLLRVVTVWMVLVSVALCIGIAMAVPVLVLIGVQQHAISAEKVEAENMQDTYTDAKAKINEANDLAGYLKTQNEEMGYSHLDLVEALDSVAPEGVYVKDYLISSGLEGIKYSVSGHAGTRSALSQFVDKIEAHDYFAEASLPINNLAKEKDIEFDITISLNE